MSPEGEVARLTGLEPATPGVTGRYSNQLSYNRLLPARTRFGRDGRSRPRALPRQADLGIPQWGFSGDLGRGRLVGGEGLEPPTLSV